MSKYDPIETFLTRCGKKFLTLDFSAISEMVSGGLPASAHKHSAWWSNEVDGQHTQARSWMEAGFRTENLDLEQKKVSFRHVV